MKMKATAAKAAAAEFRYFDRGEYLGCVVVRMMGGRYELKSAGFMYLPTEEEIEHEANRLMFNEVTEWLSSIAAKVHLGNNCWSPVHIDEFGRVHITKEALDTGLKEVRMKISDYPDWSEVAPAPQSWKQFVVYDC